MKKNILSTLLVGAAVATMGIASAQASTLDSVAGDVKFLYDGFDAAQTNYDFGSVVGGVLCDDSVVGDECDHASNLGGGSSTAPGASDGVSDTWGVTSVSSIQTNPPFPAAGNTLWNEGDDGEYLLTYFHGFEDILVTTDFAVTQTFSTGGMVDIYVVTQAQRDAAFAATDQTALDALLAPLTAYLELSFIPGCSGAVAAATLCGTFDADDFRGDSEGLAIATGGTALSKYPEQFEFEHSVEPCFADFSSCGGGSSYNVVIDSGSATTTALPEPGALGLLGLGLVGMGLMARRRNA